MLRKSFYRVLRKSDNEKGRQEKKLYLDSAFFRGSTLYSIVSQAFQLLFLLSFQKCNSNVCPVWTEWSEWTACSVTCGGGKRSKSRECVLPDGARSSGLFCEGSDFMEEKCNTDKCPGKN